MEEKNLKQERKSIGSSILVFFLLFFASCLPQQQSQTISSNGTTTESNDNETDLTSNFGEPSFSQSTTFIQEGTTKTSLNLPLAVNFNDSFLIRGLELSKLLKKIPNTTKICLVAKYRITSNVDSFLLLSAKPKVFTDLVNKTKENYLQVEPNNDVSNQNDCLSFNLTETLKESATSPVFHFSLTQICSSCSSAVTSSPLQLYFYNGEQLPNVALNSLALTLTGSINSSTNSCVENTICKARNFDCCLQGQCVKDGAIRSSALTDPNFQLANEDVTNNPDRFVLYPQFYFVCDSRPESEAPGAPPVATNDPNYEAEIRLLELEQLYNCLNLVDDEFSYCTVKFSDATTSIPGVFSPSVQGFNDDINFSSLNPNLDEDDHKNNIVKILYGGKVIYEYNKTAINDASFTSGTDNDNISSAQSVTITSSLPSNARDANLYISYKIDGTCEKISSTIAKCKKTYVQSSSETTSTFFHDSTKTYYLPTYADTSSTASIIVKIGGIIVPEDATATWTKFQNPNRITFLSSYDIFENQTIEITYFVKSNIDSLLKSKSAAQSKVNTMCQCSSSSKCNLKPILNESEKIVNFECTYPSSPTDAIPANQVAFVSNKNIPHRYFDLNGVPYDEDISTAPTQEGTAFAYTNSNLLKPNNASTYIGFNEIYGSFGKIGTLIAKPSKLIKVKKDLLYDIVVSSGSFSSCTNCGTDYYTSIQRLFPQNFAGNGGGYTPNLTESSRQENKSIYPSDDMLFGRACFLPATMIPWSHMISSSPKLQRTARLAAQHFLFANGYNRDWFGFDYGSIIGSFDGVNWFSVGNQRRIKAKSSKLFLAVNAYFGDLNVDSNFTVVISESNSFSSPIPTHDTESDGAECQMAHFCSNDRDCFANLGYDYTCQSVSSIMTAWPQFDAGGNEVVGTINKSLVSIVGGSNGQTKRCVYRGKGAPCHDNLSSLVSTFNLSSNEGTLACSPNHSCQATTQSTFNNRIARFAASPLSQNIAEVTTPGTDTFGLGARNIGRPFNYYGTNAAPTEALDGLNANNVKAICIPGKDVSNSSTNFDLHTRTPSSREGTSDKILGIGSTLVTSTFSEKFLSACPATDSTGKAVYLSNTSLSDDTHEKMTRSQNLSSSLLNLTPITNTNIFSVSGSNPVTTLGLQNNTCLRAAGATCFSDLDCGPSNFIAGKVSGVDSTSIATVMNEAEEKFWEEGLVCGNPELKFLDGNFQNPDFNSKENRCCRENGKTFTVYTGTDSSDWVWCSSTSSTAVVNLAGVNQNLSSTSRYSRINTAYDKMQCNPSSVSASSPFALTLKSSSAVNRYKQIQYQFKTLDEINSRTCCTKNWVRSFDSTNGGGHAFDKSKGQTYNLEI